MKLNSILCVLLSVASLTSAAGDGTIRGGGLADGFNDDGRNLKEDDTSITDKHMIEHIDFHEGEKSNDEGRNGRGSDDRSKDKDKEDDDLTKDDGGNK